MLAPLYELLQKDVKWSWGAAQKKAFEEVKALLTSDSVLVHYDPDVELVLACDASPYGVGAVLSHRFPDGEQKPITFASRSLGVAEKKYSQLEKEGLAIVFGVKKFHQYLCVKHIFKETSVIPLHSLRRAFSDTSVSNISSRKLRLFLCTRFGAHSALGSSSL